MKKQYKLIIGTGQTCQSCIDYFTKTTIEYKIFDTRDISCINKSIINLTNKNNFRFGYYEEAFLDDIDEAIVSPGLDINQKIINDLNQRSIPIITDIDFFKRLSDCKIISVTGTNGKTTIVTMLEYLLNQLDIKAKACGNNGISPFITLEDKFDYIIIELSSYQLQYMNNFKSYVSLISNIEDDHLERHNSFENYLNIKKKIFKNSEITFCHNNLLEYMDDVLNIRKYGYVEDDINHHSQKIYMDDTIIENLKIDKQNIYYDDISCNYRGTHNLDNILAVLSIANNLYNKKDFFKKSIRILNDFNFLPHRIEFIRSINDVKYYNDSKSTNVFSTITALKYLRKNIILIMGGSKKNLDYGKLNNYINHHVKLLVLLGENKNIINKQITTNVPKILCKTIEESVRVSYDKAKPYDFVLLSPGSPSFDMYTDFEERGNAFIEAVNSLD
ncbi:MAG: UDP-N-acetylmuramoyl-L-alanine--D-glutamate ligase [Gammaproteobacteria bacterium]|nr:UDP-N-acetylmuramoyl-L-alanine--D-glutamate ligase [Gammaproteobacteria bacterium]